MLELLTVTLNVPKHMPRMILFINIFLINIFLVFTSTLDCSGPNRSCPETVFRSVQGRIIRLKARSSDMFQRQTGIWTGSSDLGSDHPTLYNISFKMVLFQMFCLDGSHDIIYISCCWHFLTSLPGGVSSQRRRQKHRGRPPHSNIAMGWRAVCLNDYRRIRKRTNIPL